MVKFGIDKFTPSPSTINTSGGKGGFRFFQALDFKGTWNADTNTPTLANTDLVEPGLVYMVSVPGTTNFGAGDISFLAGDWVVFSGVVWEKVLKTNNVVSINGKDGIVTLNHADVGAEQDLGNPSANGQVLASSTVGTRSWKAVENPLTISTGLTRTGDIISVNEPEINHNNLLNYDVEEHRIINDSVEAATSLWSSEKIRLEIDNIPMPGITSIDHTFGPSEDGVVTSGTDQVATDSTKSWTPNEFAGRVVIFLHPDGRDIPAIIANHDADTLYFDFPTDISIDGLPYKIVDTIIHPAPSCVIACDTSSNLGAIALPPSTPEIERRTISAYIELGNFPVCIIAFGGETIRGQKYICLENRFEALQIAGHQFLIGPHWDIYNEYGIKRFAVASVTSDAVVDQTTYTPINEDLFITMSRRFTESYDMGQRYIMYTSKIQNVFEISATLKVEKSGPTGEATFAFRIIDKDGVVTDYDGNSSVTRFGSGEGVQTIVVRLPITLNEGDKVGLIAKRTAGNYTVAQTSSISIKEL